MVTSGKIREFAEPVEIVEGGEIVREGGGINREGGGRNSRELKGRGNRTETELL